MLFKRNIKKKGVSTINLIISIVLITFISFILIYIFSEKAGDAGNNLDSCETKDGKCIVEREDCSGIIVSFKCPNNQLCCLE